MTLPLVVEAADIAAADPATLRLVDVRSPDDHAAGHPPGAVLLDAASSSRRAPPVGGLLPDEAAMTRIMATLAPGADRHVVVFDAGGGTDAARLLWVLHATGFTRCSWLNGGMRAWNAAGLPVEYRMPDATGAVASGRTHDAGDVAGTGAATGAENIEPDVLLGMLEDPDLVVLDVRGVAEYAGTDVRAAEGGHVPGARHLEWTELLGADGRLLDDGTLRERFGAVGLDPGKRAVVYCQTHQRSSVTWLALKHLGHDDVRGLHGAWSAWGNRADLPKAVGDP